MLLIEIKFNWTLLSVRVFPQFSQFEEDPVASGSFVAWPCRSYKVRID